MSLTHITRRSKPNRKRRHNRHSQTITTVNRNRQYNNDKGRFTRNSPIALQARPLRETSGPTRDLQNHLTITNLMTTAKSTQTKFTRTSSQSILARNHQTCNTLPIITTSAYTHASPNQLIVVTSAPESERETASSKRSAIRAYAYTPHSYALTAGHK